MERLSFFAMASDADGVENLSELRLHHELEGLTWTMTEDDWVEATQDEKTWIGSRAIAMPDGDPLPRGLYRAVLVNKAGSEASRSLSFDPPAAPRFPFPSISVADGQYTVVSRYPSNHFIGYDAQGVYVQTITITSLEGSVADIAFNSNVQSVALWAEDSLYATSALTDAQSLF